MSLVRRADLTVCMIDTPNACAAVNDKLKLDPAHGAVVTETKNCESGYCSSVVLPDSIELEGGRHEYRFRCDAHGMFTGWTEKDARAVYNAYQYPGRLLLNFVDGSWGLTESDKGDGLTRVEPVDSKWASFTDKRRILS